MRRSKQRVMNWFCSLIVTALVPLPYLNGTSHAQTVEEVAALQLVSSAYSSATNLRKSGGSLTSIPGMAEAFFSQSALSSFKAVSGSFDPLTGRDVEGELPVIDKFELRNTPSGTDGQFSIDAAVMSGGTVRLISYSITSNADGFKIASIAGDGWTIASKAAALAGGSSESASSGSLFDQIGTSTESAENKSASQGSDIPQETDVASLDKEALIAQDGGGTPSTAAPKLQLPFEDHFDGSELSTEWAVLNPDDDSYVLENSNFLSIASGGGVTLTNPDSQNILQLTALPEGDFDIMLDAKLEARTGFDGIQLGLMTSPEDAIILSFYTFTKGCGPSLYVDFANIRPVEGEEKPVATSFNTNLFDKRWVRTVCSSLAWGRDYGDAVIAELEKSGFRLVLSRREDFFTGRVEMTLPQTENAEGGPVSFQTKALARFDLPGPITALIGQNKSAKGDTVGYIDRIAVVPVASNGRVAAE